jgi:hypothetical protein
MENMGLLKILCMQSKVSESKDFGVCCADYSYICQPSSAEKKDLQLQI